MKSVKQNVILQSIDQHRITVVKTKFTTTEQIENRLRKQHRASDSYKKT